MDNRIRIIQASEHLFRRRGAKSVTMDDIAAELGMSKKTLYQHFSNKAEVVHAVVENHIEEEKSLLDKIHGDARDAVNEIIQLMDWVSGTFKDMTPTLVHDIRKFYPEAWALFQDFKKKVAYRQIVENLERGIREGLYRPQLNVDVLARLRLEEIEICMNPEVFPPFEFEMSKVHLEVLEQFLHGVSTIRGKRLINKYLNRNEED